MSEDQETRRLDAIIDDLRAKLAAATEQTGKYAALSARLGSEVRDLEVNYLKLADAIASRSESVDDLVAEVRRLRADNDFLRQTNIDLRAEGMQLEDVVDKVNDAIGGLDIGASVDVVMAPVRAALRKLHEEQADG